MDRNFLASCQIDKILDFNLLFKLENLRKKLFTKTDSVIMSCFFDGIHCKNYKQQIEKKMLLLIITSRNIVCERLLE